MERADAASAPKSAGTLRLVRPSAELIPAVDAFHARLHAAGGPLYRLGTAVDPELSDDGRSPAVWLETRFAFDGSAVRGGIMLQHHRLQSSRGDGSVVNLQLPLSEGTIDRTYAHVGMWLIRTVLREFPNAYAVGMGSTDQPLPRLLGAMRWAVVSVPFFFRVMKPGRFLRLMPILNRTPARALLSRVARVTGGGWIGINALHAAMSLRNRDRRAGSATSTHPVTDWGTWADEIWTASKSTISVAASRDAQSLTGLYPLNDDRLRSWEVRAAGRTIGWFTTLRTPMRDSAYFGDLTVATILDCQAIPGHDSLVARAAQRILLGMDIDLAITNQQHEGWQHVFRGEGYLQAPSNFVLAVSPGLVASGGEGDQASILRRCHVTRGDGDGRLNL